MREESHLEEMRSAIRGDFERLANRRGDQELMRVVEDPGPAEDDPVLDEPGLEPENAAPEPEPSEPEPAPEPDESKRSWLSRFLSP